MTRPTTLTLTPTPTLTLTQAGRHDSARVLIEAGADVDCCDCHGRTALMFAAANGETALLQLYAKTLHPAPCILHPSSSL